MNWEIDISTICTEKCVWHSVQEIIRTRTSDCIEPKAIGFQVLFTPREPKKSMRKCHIFFPWKNSEFLYCYQHLKIVLQLTMMRLVIKIWTLSLHTRYIGLFFCSLVFIFSIIIFQTEKFYTMFSLFSHLNSRLVKAILRHTTSVICRM